MSGAGEGSPCGPFRWLVEDCEITLDLPGPPMKDLIAGAAEQLVVLVVLVVVVVVLLVAACPWWARVPSACKALCARATALRGTSDPTPEPALVKPSQAPTTAVLSTDRIRSVDSGPRLRQMSQTADPLSDPLIEAVVGALLDLAPAGVPATELHAALPEWHLDVPTPRALGLELRRHPGVVERVYRGSSRVWRLTAQCRHSVVTVSVSVDDPPP